MKYHGVIAGLLVTVSTACSSFSTNEGFEKFIAYDKSDTIIIELMTYKNNFDGKYELKSAADYKIRGEISGDVVGDTLLGSLYYTPHKWKNKKRKAIALLRKENGLVSGSGTETIYMGVPSFIKETLSFDGVIFQIDSLVKKQE